MDKDAIVSMSTYGNNFPLSATCLRYPPFVSIIHELSRFLFAIYLSQQTTTYPSYPPITPIICELFEISMIYQNYP